MLVAMGLMVAAGRTGTPDVRAGDSTSPKATDLPARDDALLQDAVKVDKPADDVGAAGG